MQHYATVDEDAPTNVSADAKNVVTMTDALPRNADERPNSKQRKPRRSQQPALEHDGRPDEDKDASGECTDVVCAGKNINSNVTTDETCPGNPEVARRKIEPMRFRTRLCRHFLENGTCPFNPNCAFAHGSHELRTLEDNMTISHPSRVGNTYSTPISSVSSLPGALPPLPLPLPLPPAGYMNASPSAPVYPYPTSYASYHPQAPSTDYTNGGSQYPYAYPAMHGSTYSPVYGGYDGYSASAFQYEYTGAPTSTEYNGVSNTGPSLHYHNPYATGMTPTLDTQPLVRSYRLDPYASYPPNFTESNNTDESVQHPAGIFYPSPNSKSLEHAPVPNEPNMHTATYQKYQNAIP